MANSISATSEADAELSVRAGGTADISVIVCTHDRYQNLTDTLASLQAQTIDESALQILIVDNSTDVRNQERFWESYSLPANAELLIGRPGLSRSRNIAVAKSRAPLVAFIDDDAIAVPDWCAAIIHAFEAQPGAGIVGGPVEAVWPDRIPTWFDEPNRGDGSVDMNLGDEPRFLEGEESLAGTNIAFRRSVLESAGGFDEYLGRIGSTLLSSAEIAVAARIAELGYGAYYAPEARVLHRFGEDRSTHQWHRRRTAWQGVSDSLAGLSSFDPDACWEMLSDYLSRLPIEMRGVRGLFLDTSDADLFNAQCQAIAGLMQLALNHGQDPENE